MFSEGTSQLAVMTVLLRRFVLRRRIKEPKLYWSQFVLSLAWRLLLFVVRQATTTSTLGALVEREIQFQNISKIAES